MSEAPGFAFLLSWGDGRQEKRWADAYPQRVGSDWLFRHRGEETRVPIVDGFPRVDLAPPNSY